ncbi:MAG: endonuclease/exonuclease/phosphatase family protein [bacterium]
MAWNIMHGGGKRAPAIARRLARRRPDVAVLSEFRDTPPSRGLAARLAGMGLPYQLTTADPKNPRRNGLLIASRWPLRRLRSRRPPSDPERWLLARVASPAPLSLAAVHVPNRVSGRKYPFLDALLAFARRWRGGDALMLGDYNTGRIGADESVPCFSRREDAFMTEMEAAGWADAYRRVRGRGRAYTWQAPGGGGRFRMDHAFVHRSAQGRLAGARIMWPRRGARPPSDHAALWIELEP